MTKRQRFKLTTVTLRSIPSGLARLPAAYRNMDWHRCYRVGLSAVVIGSPLSLIIYGELTDMPSGVRAPLFAIIGGMALAVTADARADQTWEKKLKWATSIMAVAAVGLSGYEWLRSQDAGPWISLLGSVGTALAVLALAVNIDDKAKEKDRGDDGG